MAEADVDIESRKRGVRVSLLGLALAIYLFAALVRLISSDCFLDGVVYASVSRNLADGLGSFWSPMYVTGMGPFHQHPPFFFWFESLAFRLAGDRVGVELFWSIVLGLAMLGALAALWSSVRRFSIPSGNGGQPPGPGAWWPLLLGSLPPLLSWCFTNNLLEALSTPLIVLAVWQALDACFGRTLSRETGHSLLAGGFVGLALLTKGPPALFPLLVPLWVWVCFRSRPLSGALRTTVLVAGASALSVLAAVVVGGPGAGQFFRDYLDTQLLLSVRGLKELTPYHFFLATVMIKQAILPVGAAVILGCANRKLRVPGLAGRRRWAALFFLITLSGSLPFLAFKKQMAWYIVPALPFLGMALAAQSSGAAVRFETLLGRHGALRKTLMGLTAGLLTASLVAAVALRGVLRVGVEIAVRDFYRERVLHRQTDGPMHERQSEYTWMNFCRDILDRGVRLPSDVSVSACPAEVHDHWRVLAYLQRYYRVSLTPDQGHEFVLADTDCRIGADYQPLHEPGRIYTLYRRASRPPDSGPPDKAGGDE